MKEQLKVLYNEYVNPDYATISKFSTRGPILDPIPTQTLRSFRNATSPSNPEISHSSTLYPSFKVSSKVLNKNKATYNKVMEAMRRIETESIAHTYRSVMEKKNKLDFFRLHCKVSQKGSLSDNRIDKNNKEEQYNKLAYKMYTQDTKASFLPLPYHCRECLVHGQKLEGREGATLTTIPGYFDKGIYIEERTYLFGGLSRTLYSELAYLTTSQYNSEYTWVLHDKGHSEYKRYGHTTDNYDGRLVIVAGTKMYNEDYKRRECLDDVVICDPIAKTWRRIICGGAYFEPRRYHTSCIFGNRLIVHGGLNEKDRYLDNMCSLTLIGLSEEGPDSDSGLRWAALKADNQGLGAIAYHTCSLVLEHERYGNSKSLTLMSMPELKSTQGKIAVEGIYYFGGRNSLGATNDLYILRIGRPKLEWVKPNFKGRRPSPRYAHSANFIPKKNILIVFGGRNDQEYEAMGTICMDDIWILSVETLEWTEWNRPNTIERGPEARYSHATAVLENSVVVFGGLSESCYCDASLFEISMVKKNTINKIKKLDPIKPKKKIPSKPKAKNSSLNNPIRCYSSASIGVFSKVMIGALSKFGYN